MLLSKNSKFFCQMQKMHKMFAKSIKMISKAYAGVEKAPVSLVSKREINFFPLASRLVPSSNFYTVDIEIDYISKYLYFETIFTLLAKTFLI